MGYTCCSTNFDTITIYSIASRDLYTHIHHGGQEFLLENLEVRRKAMHHFFEGIQGTFSTVVWELEVKYGINYTEVFSFKQLACYVHYEALDIYEQHSLRILGVIQIPNPAYAIAITTASQATLQIAITHHGTVPNNPNSVPISVNLSLQQLIVATVNIFPPSMHQLLLI
jgi:hypothetical protein